MQARTSCVPLLALAALAACEGTVPPLMTAERGVVFSYPLDRQLDVPLGARIVVSFSDPVVKSALGPCTATSGAFCVVGPDGPVEGTPAVVGDGATVELAGAALQPGVTYQVFVRPELAPSAKNLPGDGALFSFTTRAAGPRSAAPALVAVNGAAPDGAPIRPLVETSTLRLLFSEPLDPRTVTPDAIRLLDAAGAPVAATLVADGVHVSLDPVADLTAGATYGLAIGGQLRDLGGQPVAAATVPLVPADSLGRGMIPQVLRTVAQGDAPGVSRAGAPANVIAIEQPLIGPQRQTLQPVALRAELGDPASLGGPIAFTLRRGQRLAASGLDVKLGGELPSGLSTGDIQIELLTDANGRIYRNPYQPTDQRPENARAPLFVDLTMDLAVFTVDPKGNAVLSQTVLGVQATGTATANAGALQIETVAAMDLGLLGVATAPANFVLSLVTDPAARAAADTTPPAVVASYPAAGTAALPVGGGVDVVFSEPIDLDRARAGGLVLEDAGGRPVATTLESHGAAVVLRPLAALAPAASYRVAFKDVADVAGNALVDAGALAFTTEPFVVTSVPLAVAAVRPGVPCATTGGGGTGPGRCAGGQQGDDLYHELSLAANEPVAVEFTQPVFPGTVTLGTSCGTGSVRIEELDGAGACVGAVAGTLIRRERGLRFWPDRPWVPARHYRLTLVSGGNQACDAGELCSFGGKAASFDPLNGTGGGDGGGGNLVVEFSAEPASRGTFLVTGAVPYSDVNGSGYRDDNEPARDENRAALRITGTSGAVGSASFDMPDCVPATPEKEACMYLSGAMPAVMGELTQGCNLPDGTVAASCIPVTLSPQAMYATSVTMKASVGVSVTTKTGTTIMRVREPGAGPVMGYIVDDGGVPTMKVALDLYMDAPDMSVPLSSHDLHSKPLSLALQGPVTFLPDGRISIALSNVADVPVEVRIKAPLGISGSVKMLLPRGEMKLQLVSSALRGDEP